MRIKKSGCVESDWTCCCTEKFNMALSLCGVLEVAFYFSKSFSEVAAKELAVAKVLWPLKVTVVYFLWSPVPQ